MELITPAMRTELRAACNECAETEGAWEEACEERDSSPYDPDADNIADDLKGDMERADRALGAKRRLVSALLDGLDVMETTLREIIAAPTLAAKWTVEQSARALLNPENTIAAQKDGGD